MSQLATVMGPEGSSAPENILRAPRFHAKTDKFQYRREVRMWYQFVLTSAESGDTKAKGIAGNLGISLYSRMEDRFKRIIESAIDTGKIKFTNDDGSKLERTEQIRCIDTILNMIAKDTPTEHIRRLIKMNKEIYMCRRSKGESIPEYIARFRSAANAYLSHTTPTTATHSQDEQNFAMMIVEKAGLDLSTYNNIIKDMINDSRDNQLEPAIAVEIKKLQELSHQAMKAKEKSDASNNDIAALLTQQINKTKIAELKHIIDKLGNLNIPQDDTRLREKLRYSVSRDKAILALEDVKTSVDTMDINAKTQSTDENANVPKVGTMLGNSHEYNEKPAAYRDKNRFYAQRRKFNKQRSYGRRGYRDYTHQRRDRSGYQQDSESYDNQHRSDDDSPRESRKRPGHQRLGKRRDHEDDISPQKKIRFEDQVDFIDDDGQKDRNPYFRNQVRARSSRT